jgi:hypothetical protein
MNKSRIRKEMSALREAAVDDVINMSDEELCALLQNNGENIEALASTMRSEMREVAARVVREQAKEHSSNSMSVRAPMPRPSIERIKQLISELGTTVPNLSLAYREGKVQTDGDLQSLYDDLVSTGALKPGDDKT